MTTEQITRAFEEFCGYPPRGADLAICTAFRDDPEFVADLIWDHHLGEPRSPSRRKVVKRCKEIAKA